MKTKLRITTTIPALRAVAAAITGATAFLAAAPARAADDVTLPLPSIRWDPVKSGTTVPNTGSRDGLPDAASPYALFLKKFTGRNFNVTPGVDLVTAEGTGPFQNGRAIDLSSNPLMANTPSTDHELAMIGAPNGMALAGLGQFTFCLWYKIDSPFTGAGNAVTIIRNDNGLQLQFRTDGTLRLDVYSDTAQATGLGNLVTPKNAALTRQGKWVFLAATWDGATGAAAIHFGAEDTKIAELKAGTLRATGKLGRGSANLGLNLGYNNTSNATNSFDGWFADVRLYNTALNAEQLEKIRTSRNP